MPRKKIHLIKATQAKPFIDTASRLGVPVKLLAHRVGLPLKSVQAEEGVIGERSLWRFVQHAGNYPGCKFIGYLTALDHPVAPNVQVGGMAITLAPSLRETLEVFFRDVVTESDSCDYQLITADKGAWFTRNLVIEDDLDGWQPELYVLTVLIQIVRLHAPGDWLPARIRVATRGKPESIPAEWSSIDIEWGWRRTEMLIEKSLLSLPPRYINSTVKSISGEAHSERSLMYIQDLIDRQIWSRQTGLNYAASELGMSSATLKRRLLEMTATYSELLGERRLHHAIRLLEDSNLSIQRIAEDLGYSAVSNFSRAFSKSSGISPGDWRKKMQISPEA